MDMYDNIIMSYMGIGIGFVLVGGFNPSEQYKSQLGLLFPTEWKKKKCFKPPTIHTYIYIISPFLLVKSHILWKIKAIFPISKPPSSKYSHYCPLITINNHPFP